MALERISRLLAPQWNWAIETLRINWLIETIQKLVQTFFPSHSHAPESKMEEREVAVMQVDCAEPQKDEEVVAKGFQTFENLQVRLTRLEVLVKLKEIETEIGRVFGGTEFGSTIFGILQEVEKAISTQEELPPHEFGKRFLKIIEEAKTKLKEANSPHTLAPLEVLVTSRMPESG